MNNLMKRFFIPAVLIFICLAPMLAFFQPGLPHGHDAQDHVVRIANFYKALGEGVMFPRWGANLNWGYGHPVMMFLYPFSSYVASAFHFLGLSLVDSTKAVFVVTYIASVLSMYLWLHAIWGKRAGVIGALLYGFAPYRFIDLYVRMAIGEHSAFVFPPLIFFFLYKLSLLTRNPTDAADFAKATTAKKAMAGKYDLRPTIYYCVGLSLSFAFLILSHNAISLMFLPLIGLYILYLWIFETKKSYLFIAHCLMSIVLAFGLASFYWMPALFEGKYTLRNIITAGEALSRFVPVNRFFYSPWVYGGAETFSKSVGFVHWFGLLCSFIVFMRTKNKSIRMMLPGLWLVFGFSLFIMTHNSGFIWKQVMILQNFQFPFRFLSMTVFVSACIGAVSIAHLLHKVKSQTLKNYLFAFCCLIIIFSTVHMWKPKDYQREPESFYTRIYPGTTDTGESSPIWTTRFMEYMPATSIEVISGVASVSAVRRLTNIHEYQVQAVTRSELLENTIYFPGWEVFVDGKKTDIEFQSEIHRGVMSFWVPEGDHRVLVTFRNTKLRSIASGITIVCVMILSIGVVYTHYVWKKRT